MTYQAEQIQGERTHADGQLGHIVSWTVPKSVLLSKLRDALTTSGFTATMASDMAPRNALSRAFKAMKKGRIIRQLGQRGNLLDFQFTGERVEAGEFVYNTEAILTLDLDTSAVTGTDLSLAAQAKILLDEQMLIRVTGDLTRLVQRIYDANKADLVPIRDQGGAYFVPDKHSALVGNTRKLLTEIGGRLRSFAIRLGCADTSVSVAESLTDHIRDLLTQFRESCEDLWAGTRPSTSQHRQEEMLQLKDKLASYRSILGAYGDTIEGEIAAAETKMLTHMMRTQEPTGADLAGLTEENRDPVLGGEDMPECQAEEDGYDQEAPY